MTVRLLPLLLLVVASAAAAQSNERDDDGRERARDRSAAAHQPRAAGSSLAETVRRVERASGGQILSAERVPFDGRDMNRVKFVDAQGRVRVVTEDPQQRSRERPPRDDD